MKPKIYEEWQCDVTYKDDKPVIKPFKKIRDVSIFDYEAESQNSDTEFTKLKYVPKKTEKDHDAEAKKKEELWAVINKMDAEKKPNVNCGVAKLEDWIANNKKD